MIRRGVLRVAPSLNVSSSLKKAAATAYNGNNNGMQFQSRSYAKAPLDWSAVRGGIEPLPTALNTESYNMIDYEYKAAKNNGFIEMLELLYRGKQISLHNARRMIGIVELRKSAVQERLYKYTVKGKTSDGMVQVKYSPLGHIRHLKIHPQIQSLPEHERKEWIVSAISDAAVKARRIIFEENKGVYDDCLDFIYECLENDLIEQIEADPRIAAMTLGELCEEEIEEHEQDREFWVPGAIQKSVDEAITTLHELESSPRYWKDNMRKMRDRLKEVLKEYGARKKLSDPIAEQKLVALEKAVERDMDNAVAMDFEGWDEVKNQLIKALSGLNDLVAAASGDAAELRARFEEEFVELKNMSLFDAEEAFEEELKKTNKSEAELEQEIDEKQWVEALNIQMELLDMELAKRNGEKEQETTTKPQQQQQQQQQQ